MERKLIIECLKLDGKEVLLEGYVQRVRAHGKIAFFDLKDLSGEIQIGAFNEKLAQEVGNLSPQDVVRIQGTVKKREERFINKDSQTGTVEVSLKELEILVKSSEMPFDMGGRELNLELPTLFDNRALTLRSPKVSAIFKIQETIVNSFRKTLSNENFTEIFVPTIVPSATEGGAEVFSVYYYGHKAFLAQSPQLYKQIMVSVFERVYTVAHAYRAEPSVTTRHLAEYVSLDAEMGFINSWEEIMDRAENVIVNILSELKEKNKYELEKIFKIELPEITKPMPRVKLSEVQEIIYKRTGVDHRQEPDLDPSDEKEICEWAREQTGAPFIFVTSYPTKKRPFYTMPDPKNPDLTLSFDLLGINEEWVTGGQRINDYAMLVENMEKRGSRVENFNIYLQAFKYGMPPEGGFAMGLERITKDILGLSNVREASLFPRDMERVDERFSIQEKRKE